MEHVNLFYSNLLAEKGNVDIDMLRITVINVVGCHVDRMKMS